MTEPAIIGRTPEFDWQDIDGMVWMSGDGEHDYTAVHNDPATGQQCRASPRTVDVTSGTKHRLVSADPLHIEPSLLCEFCGWHGFIRNGHWVPA